MDVQDAVEQCRPEYVLIVGRATRMYMNNIGMPTGTDIITLLSAEA